MNRLLLFGMLAVLLAGCGSSADYYLLHEWGDGWKLEVKELPNRAGESAKFSARWIEGKNRSVHLINLDDRHAQVTIINELYVELDAHGNVVAGQLKRVVSARNDPKAFKEGRATWFKVLSGACVVDARLHGKVDVRCEGDYVFAGTVRPAKNVKKIEPEKKK